MSIQLTFDEPLEDAFGFGLWPSDDVDVLVEVDEMDASVSKSFFDLAWFKSSDSDTLKLDDITDEVACLDDELSSS